jgi:mono/diheme cytochrome c family protein
MKKTMKIVATLAFVGTPVLSDEAAHPLLATGKETYKTFCSHCHGLDMVNPGTSSYDLRKWPVNDEGGFRSGVLNGKGDMPAWGDVLLPEEVDALWVYVATRAGKEPFPESDEPLGTMTSEVTASESATEDKP